MTLHKQLQLEKQLRAGRVANEAAVSQGVALPLLHVLGWPVFDTTVVVPEYTLDGRRADYALCDPITHTNLEGVGVDPAVKVAASRALAAAQKQLREKRRP